MCWAHEKYWEDSAHYAANVEVGLFSMVRSSRQVIEKTVRTVICPLGASDAISYKSRPNQVTEQDSATARKIRQYRPLSTPINVKRENTTCRYARIEAIPHGGRYIMAYIVGIPAKQATQSQ